MHSLQDIGGKVDVISVGASPLGKFKNIQKTSHPAVVKLQAFAARAQEFVDTFRDLANGNKGAGTQGRRVAAVKKALQGDEFGLVGTPLAHLLVHWAQ